MDEDPTSTRRELITSVLGTLGAVGAAAWAGREVGSRWLGGAPSAAAVPGLAQPATGAGVAARLGLAPYALPIPPAGKLAFPVDPAPSCYVLDNYGDCRDGGDRMHIGVDIGASRGRMLFAVADGELTHQFTNTGTAGFGWTLRRDDGWLFRYFHLDSFVAGLKLGDRVSFGQPIGYMGSSGNYLPGTKIEDRNNIHLHFEVWPERGVTVDALPLFDLPRGVQVGRPLKGCLHRA